MGIPEQRPMGRYLTTGEAAVRLGVSERHCRRMIKRGRLPGTKFERGGAWRIPSYVFESEFMMDAVYQGYARALATWQAQASQRTQDQNADIKLQKAVLDGMAEVFGFES